jgi:hypothetical protein
MISAGSFENGLDAFASYYRHVTDDDATTDLSFMSARLGAIFANFHEICA